MALVSAEDISEYTANGAVCLRGVFSPDWIANVTRGIEKSLANPSAFAESLKDGQDVGSYFNDYFNWKNIPEFGDFVYNSPAARIAQQLMQSSSVTFYHEYVLVKEQGALKETPWHQDQSYYPFNGEKACSIWMLVDPISLQTTLTFIRGSHKTGWYFPRKFATSLNYPLKSSDQPSTLQENVYQNVPSPAQFTKEDIIRWTLNPGDCIVFHMKTLHGASGNATSTPRRILSTRWFGDDVVMATRPWEPSPPYTGTLREGDHPSRDTVFFPLII